MSVVGWKLLVSVVLLARQVACSPPTVWTFQDHGEALIGWNEAFRSGILSGPATLIHFDSHADMALPHKWFDIKSQSSSGLSENVHIDNFIPIAVLAGLVDRVVWVKPEWGGELDYGSYNFMVAEDEEGGLFQTDAPFSEYPERVDTGTVESLDNVHQYSVDVIPVTKQALESLNLETGPWILDIDLDVFSTENLGGKFLRENLELDFESVERFQMCKCPDEANCETKNLYGEAVPSEFVELLMDASEEEIRYLMEDICRAPIHYSSDEEVDAAVSLLFDWVEQVVATPPGVVTVSESTSGFLPEEQLSRVKIVAPGLAQLFDSASPPKWIECSACVNLTIHNDIGIHLDLFWGDDENHEMFYQDTLAPGEKRNLSCRMGEEFELVSVEGDSREFIVSVVSGEKRQQFSVSQLEIGTGMQCAADTKSSEHCN